MERLLNDILHKNLNMELKDKTGSRANLRFSLEKDHQNNNQTDAYKHTNQTSVQINEEVNKKREIIVNNKIHFMKLLRVI